MSPDVRCSLHCCLRANSAPPLHGAPAVRLAARTWQTCFAPAAPFHTRGMSSWKRCNRRFQPVGDSIRDRGNTCLRVSLSSSITHFASRNISQCGTWLPSLTRDPSLPLVPLRCSSRSNLLLLPPECCISHPEHRLPAMTLRSHWPSECIDIRRVLDLAPRGRDRCWVREVQRQCGTNG